MDDITVEQFRELLPAFSDSTVYPDDEIQSFINLAVVNFNGCFWGSRLQVGEAMWVAHWLTIAGSSSNMPATIPMPSFAISKKVGDTSITYSDKILEQQMQNPYLRTPYGQQYWFMVQHLGPCIMIV